MINQLFRSRYNLHHDCYNHKTIHAYELMVCDALIHIDKVLYDFSEVIWDPEQYLLLDDSILDEILTVEFDDPRIDNDAAKI